VTKWYLAAGFDAPRLRGLERHGFSVCGSKRGVTGLKMGANENEEPTAQP